MYLSKQSHQYYKLLVHAQGSGSCMNLTLYWTANLHDLIFSEVVRNFRMISTIIRGGCSIFKRGFIICRKVGKIHIYCQISSYYISRRNQDIRNPQKVRPLKPPLDPPLHNDWPHKRHIQPFSNRGGGADMYNIHVYIISLYLPAFRYVILAEGVCGGCFILYSLYSEKV
jgi:hypothetical protein